GTIEKEQHKAAKYYQGFVPILPDTDRDDGPRDLGRCCPIPNNLQKSVNGVNGWSKEISVGKMAATPDKRAEYKALSYHKKSSKMSITKAENKVKMYRPNKDHFDGADNPKP
ncbi:12808_t:CDS:2, partial [Gigaspora rosea]